MKKGMSRFVRGLTATVTMDTLTACSSGLGETKSTVPVGSELAGNSKSAAQQGGIQVEMKTTVVWRIFDDQSQSGSRVIMQNEAGESDDITLNMQNVTNNISTVDSKLEVTLSKKTDVVAICVPDRKSIENMMKKCDADDMLAVSPNMEPMEGTMNRYENIWYVGAQAKQSSEICAQTLTDYWNDNKNIADRNGGRRLSLVVLQGEIGQQDMTLRTDAYKEILEKNRIEYEILAYDTASWDQAQASDKMDTWTTAYGIDGIEDVLYNNDSMAVGAVQVCISNGYNSGDAEKFVPIVGTDANIDILETIKAGSLLDTVLNDRKSQLDATISVIRAIHTGMEIAEDMISMNCAVDGRYVRVSYVTVDRSNLSATLEDILAVARSE